MTQEVANRRMDRSIRLAVAAEVRRDASAYESPAYWRLHDLAMRHHKAAEQFMPRSARTIS